MKKSSTQAEATAPRYEPPVLRLLGQVTEVTRKSGGSSDGGAAMMDKSGGG